MNGKRVEEANGNDPIKKTDELVQMNYAKYSEINMGYASDLKLIIFR